MGFDLNQHDDEKEDEEDSETETEDLRRVEATRQGRGDRDWPGVRANAKGTYYSRRVETIRSVDNAEQKKRKTRWVKMKMGGVQVILYCDTGSTLR